MKRVFSPSRNQRRQVFPPRNFLTRPPYPHPPSVAFSHHPSRQPSRPEQSALRPNPHHRPDPSPRDSSPHLHLAQPLVAARPCLQERWPRPAVPQPGFPRRRCRIRRSICSSLVKPRRRKRPLPHRQAVRAVLQSTRIHHDHGQSRSSKIRHLTELGADRRGGVLCICLNLSPFSCALGMCKSA